MHTQAPLKLIGITFVKLFSKVSKPWIYYDNEKTNEFANISSVRQQGHQLMYGLQIRPRSSVQKTEFAKLHGNNDAE
jgi:hypothetical protein